MSGTLAFTKMSGAGNDFVVVEDDGGIDGKALAQALCPRRTSIGADGVLLVKRRGRAGRPSLTYFNADGSRAFCGNGSRCAALWMRRNGWTGDTVRFDTEEGTLDAVIVGAERVRLRMPQATAPRAVTAEVRGHAYKGWALDTGVPHFVVPVRGLDGFPVETVGRALRSHRAFKPAGANVNFVAWGRPLRVRTYERGVEAETLACGTGVTATALAAGAAGKARSPVALQVRSGDRLTVSWSSLDDVWIEGPAKIVFEGRVAR